MTEFDCQRTANGSMSVVSRRGGVLLLTKTPRGWSIGVQPDEGNEMLMFLSDDEYDQMVATISAYDQGLKADG